MSNSDEKICAYATGLMSSTEAEQFEAEARDNPPAFSLLTGIADASCLMLREMCPQVAPRPGLKQRVLAAIENEPALVLADREGRVVGINEAFTAMCGYPAEAIVGRRPGRILRGPATCPIAANELNQAVRNGTPCEQEIVNYHRNGTPYWVLVKITPLRNPMGELMGFAAVEQKLAEREVAA